MEKAVAAGEAGERAEAEAGQEAQAVVEVTAAAEVVVTGWEVGWEMEAGDSGSQEGDWW